VDEYRFQVLSDVCVHRRLSPGAQQAAPCPRPCVSPNRPRSLLGELGLGLIRSKQSLSDQLRHKEKAYIT